MRSFLFLFFAIFFSSAYSQNEVKYLWSGALTFKSVKVNAKMTDSSSAVQLVVSQDSLFSFPDYSILYSVGASTNYMVSLEINGLNPQTKYFYAIQSDGIIDTSAEDIGSFTTWAIFLFVCYWVMWNQFKSPCV